MQSDPMRGKIGTEVRRPCAPANLFSGAADVR